MPHGHSRHGSQASMLSNNEVNNTDSGLSPEDHLTSREESDLERLLAQTDFTIQDAEAFTERLVREVATMDASNIQAIMQSEARVAALMDTLQIAVEETQKLESKLEHYQSLFKNVRDTVFQVEKKEALVHVQEDNKERLKEELENLLKILDFPRDLDYTLSDGDLTTDEGIESCVKAAQALDEAINTPVNPILMNMMAVQEQKQKLLQLQGRFGYRVAKHIIAVIQFLVRGYGQAISDQSMGSADLVLPGHSLFYSNLIAYTPLVKWCKKSARSSFDLINEQYILIMKDQYSRSIEVFFEAIREKLSAGKGSTVGSHGETSSVGQSTISRRTRSSSIHGGPSSTSTSTDPTGSDTISSKSSEISLSEWEDFDHWIDRMLSAIDPICLSEQQFCLEFFDMVQPPATIPSSTSSPSNIQKLMKRRTSSPMKSSSPSPSSRSGQSSDSQLTDAKKNEELRLMMSSLFEQLEVELERLTSHYNQLDGVYSMYLMVRLTQHVLEAQDTGSFLVKVYGKILILVKRNFDSFMEGQKRLMDEARVPKKAKCGVFHFIKKFESLAKQAELIFKASRTRRTDIDRWYVVLVRSMFDSIERLASQHPKTPGEMVKIENYHALSDVLRGLKIPCLENEQKEAKTRYNEAINDYVKKYFGRPLEKLSAFFEGVQAKISQGVKAEEVGYHMAYSKSELRRVISVCSLKEVKKGLEDMYRRVEKHATEPDSTLIQVIWRSMQEEFLSQYKIIVDMIEKCYPDANISLSFTVQDVLDVFSDIARSH